MTRLIVSITLALVLTFTGHNMAIARGAAAASGQMVICTGVGPLVVYVDAKGQPTSAPLICPDAALHALVDTAPIAGVTPEAPLVFRHATIFSPNFRLPRLQATPPSRAPPVMS